MSSSSLRVSLQLAVEKANTAHPTALFRLLSSSPPPDKELKMNSDLTITLNRVKSCLINELLNRLEIAFEYT